ncbi:SGNH/GDSL hydrolase family protein [archaeon]|nr:SGNH/GDSL hydrolase family protein [archaeon]
MNKIYKKSLLLIFSLIIIVIIIESSFYVYKPKISNLKPNSHTFHSTTDIMQMFEFNSLMTDPFITNSDGFRDYEYTKIKDSNIYRIIMLGDSVVFGYNLENLSQTIPKKLEYKLLNSSNETTYEVLNMGVYTYNSVQELHFFINKGLKYDPDLLIIGYFLNDPEWVESSLYPYLAPTKRKIYEQNLLALLPKHCSLEHNMKKSFFGKLILSIFKKNILRFDSPNYFSYITNDPCQFGLVEHSFNSFKQLSDTYGFNVLVVIFPYFTESSSELAELQIIHYKITNLSLNNNFYVLDLYNLSKENYYGEITINRDRTHYNNFGTEVVSNIMLEYLQKNNILS